MLRRAALAVLGSLPLVAFFTTLAFAAYAWSVTGHWPYYAHPDPKELPLTSVGHLWSASVVLAAVSLGVYPAAAILSFAMGRLSKVDWLRLNTWHVTAFVTGVVLWAGETIVRGPRCLLSWLVD
jgi:hypothetical protein